MVHYYSNGMYCTCAGKESTTKKPKHYGILTPPGGRLTPNSGLYREPLPERGAFFKLAIH